MTAPRVVEAFNEVEDLMTRFVVRAERRTIDQFALERGKETLAHRVQSDRRLIASMVARQAPTPVPWKHFARYDRMSTQEQITKTADDQLRAFASAGGTVLFGTDLGRRRIRSARGVRVDARRARMSAIPFGSAR